MKRIISMLLTVTLIAGLFTVAIPDNTLTVEAASGNLAYSKTATASSTDLSKLVNLAYGKSVIVSSSQSAEYSGSNAVDGDGNTSWVSTPGNEQNFIVDLGENQTVSKVKIAWGSAYASSYQVQVSNDYNTWTTVYENYNGNGQTQEISFNATSTRYVKLYCINQANGQGFSLSEFEIYGSCKKLEGKKLLFLGSSVTYGYASGGVSFVDYLAQRNNCTVVKEAVSGTTLVDNGSSSYVQRMIKNMSSQTGVDYFVCQLSTNDASQNLPLGSVSSSYNMQDFNISTIIGAMEYIIAYAKNQWNCPVSFYTGTYYSNSNYQAMVDALYELQKKWGIGIIDLWNNEAMRNVSDSDYWRYMSDTVHPTAAGYLEWWTPAFEAYFNNEALNAIDADGETSWSSGNANNQNLIVDLGTAQSVSSVKIDWGERYASSYQVQVSNDYNTWTTVYENYNASGGKQTINFDTVTARYVKLYSITSATSGGFTVNELEIYENASEEESNTESENNSGSTDSGATSAATAKENVLNYLYQMQGSKTIIGMHNREPNSEPAKQTNQAIAVTGQTPALWSGDFLFSSSDVANRWNMIYECERQWNNGAIVHLMLHVNTPLQSEVGNWDGGVCSELTDEQWNSLITDGGELNTVWKSRLDGYAVYLQYLEDKGVPVLFRPFHEMNQSLFWWAGRTGSNGTAALYRLTRDYLEDVKGLDNIIWVWDMQDLSYDWSEYNPGNDYWDIFAVDVYNSDYFTTYKYNKALEVAGNKLIAIGECDHLPTADELRAQPRWSFVMSWAELTFSHNTNEEIQNLYWAENVIVKDELPSFKVATQNSKNYITNGDFTTVDATWPNLPTGYSYSYTGGDGYSPIKGENGAFVGYAENAYTFVMKQQVENIPNGTYSLSADMRLLDGASCNEIVITAGSVSKSVLSELNSTAYSRVAISEIQVSDGRLDIAVSGNVNSKGLFIDNLVLNCIEQSDSNEDDNSGGTSKDEFKLVGYLPNWYGDIIDDVQLEKFTHINYAFAIPDENGNIRTLTDEDFINKLITTAHENGVKVLISVGGWSYNGVTLESTFVSATNTDEKCRTFANNIISLVEQYGFDGADIDWEYPRSNTSGQYETFMGYLHDGLTENGKLLTAAVIGCGSAADAYPDSVLEMMDWVNVMAYDGNEGAGHSPYSFALECGNYWRNTRGLAAEKVVLGVPFYERPNWASYANIVAADSNNAYKDSTTINGTTVYYNGLETIAEKTEWACENAGGIMIWEISQDSKNANLSLLNKICETRDRILEENTPQKVVITFNSLGGTAVSSQTIDYGTTPQRPADPTREGYKFAGWYTDEACTTAYDFGALTSHKVVYAKWDIDDIPVETVEITSQPQNVTANVGDTATFTVGTTGNVLSYQWQCKTPTGSWKNISSSVEGYNQATLYMEALDARNGYQYRCVVKDGNGKNTITDAATLTVVSGVTITSQPQDVYISVNGTAVFSVEVTGNVKSYKWQCKKPDGSWKNVSSSVAGYNEAIMSIPAIKARDGYQFRCVVKDEKGKNTITEVATLTINPDAALTITSQPKSVAVTAGTKASFSVAAKGEGLFYLWQYRTSSIAEWNYCAPTTEGYNTATITVDATASTNGYQYRCIIINENAATLISNAAKLTVE